MLYFFILTLLFKICIADDSEDNLRAQVNLAQHLARRPITGRAKNVVLVVGDASEVVSLAARRHTPGEHAPALKRFPYVGLCTAAPGTESACSSSTSSLSFKWTYAADEEMYEYNCTNEQSREDQNDSILRRAQLAGKSTGLITSGRITRGYSNGGSAHYYAKVANEHWENDVDVSRYGGDPDSCDDIAEQLIYGATGRDLQVILGWGRRNFRDATYSNDEECLEGSREDGMDLISEWRKDKLNRRVIHSFIWDNHSLRAQNLNKTEYLLGLFEPSNDRNSDDNKAPSLNEMMEAALTVLNRNPKGYLLILEGRNGYHNNRNIDEDNDFEEAIKSVLDKTNPQETLLVVTAQHSSKYTRDESTMNTDNGSGASVFSRGPWAQLLTGTYEQLYIEHAVNFAACLQEGFTACTR